uniref:MADS-box domain-containing protein n=1 Tax=Kalanchoe fedtschenkoi TaxID=63787 RepID=A0A7N0TVP9_KALFE
MASSSNNPIANSTVPFTTSSTDVVPNPNTSSSSVAIASPTDVPPPPPVAPSTAAVPPPDVPSLSTSGRKKSKGRGKIEMRKMEKESNMLVTFSKRKSNLLKKANELCTLCGVKCAIVVFSPAGKVFSFGHPSVDQVTDRYLNGILNPTPSPPPPNQVPQNPSEGQHQAGTDIVQTLSAELSKLTSLLEASKKHGQALDERRAARMATNWNEEVKALLDGLL